MCGLLTAPLVLLCVRQTLAVYREDTARWDGDKEKYLLVYDVNYLRAQVRDVRKVRT